MCGLAGFVDFKGGSQEHDLRAMQNTLAHRGPDDQGIKLYRENNFLVGLAHRRLSILDLSPLGHQPMFYNQFALILNGEIYNFKEIRDELISLGHSFRSESDTETVLHAFAEWGKSCVSKFIGMFAFVLYDTEKKILYGCRDRVGVKPFFYYWNDGLFMFASELKAFHKHPGFVKELDDNSIYSYLQHGYIPGPASIFKNVKKLEGGSWMTFDLNKQNFAIEKYWSPFSFYKGSSVAYRYQEAKAELEKLLFSACHYRMVADVPVGIFLSGGYDSTLVASLLQRNSQTKLKTFTIGFPDGVNEGPFAEAIAKHLGTDHETYNCTESDAKSIIPELAYYYDEPCADISTIPTILVSRLARKHVTVALSADGGDELFGGYVGFRTKLEQLARIRKVPFPMLSGRVLHAVSSAIPFGKISTKRKIAGVANVLKTKKDLQLNTLLNQGNGIPSELVTPIFSAKRTFRKYEAFEDVRLEDERNVLFLHAFDSMLTDYLLVKVDRATMSAGLEGREPLLDHRLIEFSARLPYEFKHDGKISKYILRDIVHQYVPKEIMDRPKTGFDLPLLKWLKNDLSYLISENLSNEAIAASRVFDRKIISQLVKDFQNNRLEYPDIIWRLIVFQQWYKIWC